MPLTSEWPLSQAGVRFLTPLFLREALKTHDVAHLLYPLALGFYPQASGHRMQRGEHDSHLLIFCTAGLGYIAIGEQEALPMQAGDLVVLPKGQAHHYQADIDKPWTIYWVHYDGSQADYFSKRLQHSSPLHIGPQPQLISDFERLFALRESAYVQQEFVHAALLLMQMLSACTLAARRPQVGHDALLDIQHIRDKLQRQLDKPVDLQQLANEAGLSKFHFARRFKQLTGQSPIQYHIHLRMQLACALLDQTELSIKQVAAKTGFSDPYYFSRSFKKVVGLSPTHYRQH